jgi:RES domain-containing protein
MWVYRISRRRHATTAFSGEGARLFDARWNIAGSRMVYTSQSISLAALEVFVNLDPHDEGVDLVSLAAQLPVNEEDVDRVELKGLPPDWRRTNHPVRQRIGTDWVASRRSLALLVPSAAIDGEWNVLLNPAHPDAATIKIGEPKPFRFDPRMFKVKLSRREE